ncbi:hypothetical protein AAL_02694 [Moelleriella libera RCEF 2490]|uniref:Uncharacterized protein n=1 Tax=Moelleriella libera RCEF 2490 TaxID=1081109 RepID=A0A168ETX7_9HYPO|nr:hypothetical protein AAL_02694 [Moelleriella libera RCEF 2490]
MYSDDLKSHSHSPRRQGGGDQRPAKFSTKPFQGDGIHAAIPMASHRCMTHPLSSPLSLVRLNSSDPFFGQSSTYAEWLQNLGRDTVDAPLKNTFRFQGKSRNTRMSSTDISMPDYVSLPAEDDTPQEDKHGTCLKVPTNTPNTADYSIGGPDGELDRLPDQRGDGG